MAASSAPKRTKVSSDERDSVMSTAVLDRVSSGANIAGMDAYRAQYDASIADPDAFWREQAERFVSWSKGFDDVCSGSFVDGDVRWFSGEMLRGPDRGFKAPRTPLPAGRPTQDDSPLRGFVARRPMRGRIPLRGPARRLSREGWWLAVALPTDSDDSRVLVAAQAASSTRASTAWTATSPPAATRSRSSTRATR